MSGSKDNILAIIRALTARTTENGCTEAEALAATLKVAELMDRHGFATADLAEKEEVTTDTYFFKGKKLEGVSFCAVTLASFCDVKLWATRSGPQAGIKFLGRESDVAVVQYLLHLFHTSMGHEFTRFARTPAYAESHRRGVHGKTLRSAFEKAMAARLSERLREMKAARNQSTDTATGRTGRDLVVVKGQEVAAAFAALNMKLTGGGRRTYRSNAAASAAGRAAGDRVSITTGVGGGYTKGLIGR